MNIFPLLSDARILDCEDISKTPFFSYCYFFFFESDAYCS